MSARRAVVVVLATSLALSLLGAGGAAAAPKFRKKAVDTKPNPAVILRGGGWGHGVGMSQYGAYSQAQAGWGYSRILKHWYRGIDVGRANMPSRIRVGLSSTMTFSNVDAVTGSVPWRVCSGGCTTVATQPKGTTYRVTLLSGGRFRLRRGSNIIWTGGKGQRLIAAFNPRGAAGGTQIEAYNPNGPRRQYKWGRLEYTANSPANGTMFMVVDVPGMEKYLRGLAEMPSSWGVKGVAALKAQAVAGRTYALSQHRAFGGMRPDCRCSLLATPRNQAYTGYDKELESFGRHWVKAVDDTAARVATHNGKLISTFYSSSHGRRSENSEDSWAYGGSRIPYLRSVSDKWSGQARAGNPLSSWRTRATNRRFARFTGSGISKVRRVQIISRTAGGTPKTIRVRGLNSRGRAVTVNRSGTRGIVGINMRTAFSYSGHVNLSTLPSQQIRKIGFGPFNDDDGKVHEYASLYATRARLMKGRTKTKFAPGAAATRGEAAVAVFKMLRIPAAPKGRDYFRDDNGRAEEKAINALAHAGIIPKKPNRFYPDRPLRRWQAARFLHRALGLRPGAKDRFTDDNGKSYERSINAVARKGLMSGCGGRKFCPKRKVKRGQFATILFKTVEAYR